MKKNLRFAVLPKVEHPWFNEVKRGAQAQASLLAQQLGVEVTVDYRAPIEASVAAQRHILAELAASNPDGLAIDPVEPIDRMPLIAQIQRRGTPLVLFDSPSPQPGITSIGNDFRRQGSIAAEQLISLLGGRGKVAVMRGFPSAPNHQQRYEAQCAALGKHPGITLIDGGVDNDDIETARQQATQVLQAHADLAGYLCCDAAGPIGIAQALRQSGRAGSVRFVAMDGIKPILEAIKEGVIDASSASDPFLQGAMSVLLLWHGTLGLRAPQAIDTGISLITRENVDAFLSACD